MGTRRISHRERLQACLAGEIADRPAVALWRHFPVDDQTPEGLVSAVLAFQKTYDFDLVKVTPASSFCLKDWGVQDEWRGDPEGTRTYVGDLIHQPQDWERLPVLDPTKGYLGEELHAIRQIVQALGPDTPVLQTIFSPLAQAKNLAGKSHLVGQLRRYPEAVHAGLQTITESTRRFIEAALETGIAGVFFAVQHAQFGLVSQAEYLEFGRAYDLKTLEPAQGLWLNMLHLHGTDVMFDQVLWGQGAAGPDLPVAIVNWHDQETPPSLSEAQQRFGGVVCGGLRRTETMVLGEPAQVMAEARAALDATGGRRFILGTGCVMPITAPHANIWAARQSVELEG